MVHSGAAVWEDKDRCRAAFGFPFNLALQSYL